LIGLLQKDPKQWKLDGPTRLRFTRDLEERKVRMEWIQGFIAELAKNRI
jgi:transcription-repair coupling factor (superfamily II helicase)